MGASEPVRDELFAAAVTCIDGRTHGPLTRWVKDRAKVDHVDLITRPGVDATLSDCSHGLCDGIRDHLAVSAIAHGSRVVAIAGHDDCAGNPVPADEHRRQIADAVRQVRGWELGLEVIGVWIDDAGTVSPIPDDSAALDELRSPAPIASVPGGRERCGTTPTSPASPE